MIIIKSDQEIELMRESGKVTGTILKELEDFVKPGISTDDINTFVESNIRKAGMIPTFLGYGGFPASACVSINEEVVHGIPDKNRILQEGDIVSVDVGSTYKGYVSDAARTYPVGSVSETAAKLMEATKASFFAGIEYCKVGFRLSDISHAIQVSAEGEGFSVIRDFTGHGIGRDLHEDPAIPNYGKAGHGPKLVPGMTLAIEPMIAVGDYDVEILSNDWTAVTTDGSFAAHYVNTIVITEGEPRILTLEPEGGLI